MARYILNDYTKSNNWFYRFITLHWDRHYVKEAAKIVDDIDNGILKTPDDVKAKLSEIKLDTYGGGGSLLKRLSFLSSIKAPAPNDEILADNTQQAAIELSRS